MTRFGRSSGRPAARRRRRPAALQRHPAEHRGLAGAGRRAADRGRVARRGPQAGDHLHAAALELRRLGVLVLVDHVLVEALVHEPAGGRLHPGRHERREVQPRVAVEHQLVVDDLVGAVGRHLLLGELQARDRMQLAGVGELRPDVEVGASLRRDSWIGMPTLSRVVARSVAARPIGSAQWLGTTHSPLDRPPSMRPWPSGPLITTSRLSRHSFAETCWALSRSRRRGRSA